MLSIADSRRRRWRPRLPSFACLVGLAAAVPATIATASYHAAGLTLSHYDARAHLVVARRVFDSLTPGWQQLGAVWLPLPHLLNLLPVQVDAWYRSGASAIAISMVAFLVATAATARLVRRVTGSPAAAGAGAAVFALNPNILYLQATPMTEPLLLGLTLAGVAWLLDWVEAPTARAARIAGVLLAAACLTRYEAWGVTTAAMALAALARWRRGDPAGVAIRQAARLAIAPIVAVAAFLLHSRLSTGVWFVTGGFFVADNPLDTGRPVRALVSVWWGAHEVSSYPLLLAATAGVAATVVAAARRASDAPALVTLSLAAAAALPWYAFLSGHPFRFRYMVPLVAPVAVMAAIGIGRLPGRARLAAAGGLLLLALAGRPPLDPHAPMVIEAQLDSEHRRERRAVTARLVQDYAGEPILASMASLAHYLHELADQGFALRDFVHEGNGDSWRHALEQPSATVGWILIEEQSEGGDVLAAHARTTPGFLTEFDRVGEGGGLALYRRNAPAGPLGELPRE